MCIIHRTRSTVIVCIRACSNADASCVRGASMISTSNTGIMRELTLNKYGEGVGKVHYNAKYRQMAKFAIDVRECNSLDKTWLLLI